MHITAFRWTTNFTQSPEGKLWDSEPVAPAGGDTPPTPAPATPGASAQPAIPANAAPTATPSGTQAPATGAPEGWVPSYRVRETREATQRELRKEFETREAAYRSELERINTQLQALVGVQPQKNPQEDAVRSQFSQLYPGLSALEQRAQDIMSFLEQSNDIQAQNEHYWQTYGRQSMDKLFSLASNSYGSPISDEAKRVLHSSFVGFVQSSPEMTERYASDPTIVEDFWKAFSSSFIDPSRRAVASNVATRASVGASTPQDTPGGVPPMTPGPKPKDLDERVAMGWAQYNSTKK